MGLTQHNPGEEPGAGNTENILLHSLEEGVSETVPWPAQPPGNKELKKLEKEKSGKGEVKRLGFFCPTPVPPDPFPSSSSSSLLSPHGFPIKLQNSSEKRFGMRIVMLCPEKWDDVTPRNRCEWKRELCVP
ncbi:hypothetical protein EK904_011148 [Melospiza melodia maxima]|nr:hypothetical protein EK904_011148 [Melospiza melodia maxima]